MPKPQTVASAKYNVKTYEDIKIRVKKGERERYKAEAQRLGLSLNQLFIKSVEQYLAEHAE